MTGVYSSRPRIWYIALISISDAWIDFTQIPGMVMQHTLHCVVLTVAVGGLPGGVEYF